MTLFDPSPAPPVALWHRRSRRCKWRVHVRAESALAALWLMRGAGEWMLISEGYDPNETTLARVQRGERRHERVNCHPAGVCPT